MSIILDGSASATFATPLPVAQGGSGGVSAAAALINLQASVPAFSAYQSVAQSLPTGTITKLQFQTKEFDTGNYYDAVTNFRYTPLVAGYYQITASFQIASVITSLNLYAYKNGINFKSLSVTQSTGQAGSAGTALVFLNGTTDYIEIFGSQSAAAQNIVAVAALTYFQAVLVKAT